MESSHSSFPQKAQPAAGIGSGPAATPLPTWVERGNASTHQPAWGDRGSASTSQPTWADRRGASTHQPTWASRGGSRDGFDLNGELGRERPHESVQPLKGKETPFTNDANPVSNLPNHVSNFTSNLHVSGCDIPSNLHAAVPSVPSNLSLLPGGGEEGVVKTGIKRSRVEGKKLKGKKFRGDKRLKQSNNSGEHSHPISPVQTMPSSYIAPGGGGEGEEYSPDNRRFNASSRETPYSYQTSLSSPPLQSGNATSINAVMSHPENPLPTPIHRHRHHHGGRHGSPISEAARTEHHAPQSIAAPPHSSETTVATPTSVEERVTMDYRHVRVKKEPGLTNHEHREKPSTPPPPPPQVRVSLVKNERGW